MRTRVLVVLHFIVLFAATSMLAQTANYVVIAEFATRGTSTATDEFVELYNPTDNALTIASWKLQYKSATGSTWNDYGTIPAGATIPARGFYLLANTGYGGATSPDYRWGTSGLADNGNMRIVDATGSPIDRVGWGTANDPEGSPAPNHGTTANNNSVERKARANSTADSLFTSGRHALLGNGYDTQNNSADFVEQIRGRNPQNSNSAQEPSFSTGGNGTGRVTASPAFVFTNRSVSTLSFSFRQDSSYTIASISLIVPSTWSWSRNAADVQRTGTAFQSAAISVSGDTITITQAALTTTDSGAISIVNLTSPATKGLSTFNVRTAIAGGALAPVATQPRIRILNLVPIVTVHVNDATGVPAAPFGLGEEVTVTGIVTANYSTVRTDVYVQDGTGGINVFSFDTLTIPLDRGDSVTVTGTILQFRGLTELGVEFSLLQKHASGHPVPAPMVMRCAEVNSTFRPDYTEPNESRLIRINGVTYNQTASTITDASGTTGVFIPNTFPPTPGVFDIVGILKQFKPGTPAPGPPFTADYEIVPRDSADIIAHPGPIITSVPFEDNIQANSVQLNWTTNVASSSIVRYGLTQALGDSVIVPAAVLNHSVTVASLLPARAYYYAVGSGDANGTTFSPVYLFSSGSPTQSTGAMNVYFNKSVNTTLAWFQPANGNQNLVQRIVTRINNARRSIDACLYSLSGTPGPGTDIANALIAAKNRGIRVRVICENDNRNTAPLNALAANSVPLITDGFDVVNNGIGLMHNKFFTIDARGGAAESIWVWTGSWNPTDPGTNNDYQNAIELQDPAIANAFLMEFNEMWGSEGDVPNAGNARFGPRKLDNTPHRFAVKGKPIELYFSPSDGANAKIVREISLAQYSVSFQLLLLTRRDIADALIARKNAGKKVRGDMDDSSDSGSQFGYLRTNGIDVRLKTVGTTGLLHHKYALIDAENPYWNPVTITGSHNWSNSAETQNNENTLILRDGNIANQYLQEFAARYAQFGGTDPILVDVDETNPSKATSYSLEQNYPNPFNPTTTIRFSIPSAQLVTLSVFDILGRNVATLIHAKMNSGNHKVEFNGDGLASGVYFYRLETGTFRATKKTMLMK